MLKIKKSVMGRIGRAGALALMLTVMLVGVAAAAGTPGFSITTTPVKTNAPFYVDANKNLIDEPSELVGNFDFYNGNSGITFSWTPVQFPSGLDGSYRVSLLQNITPGVGVTPTWRETKVTHHWASAGTTYTMGAFGYNEAFCAQCPSVFKIVPEVVTLKFDPLKGYLYEYSSLGAEYAGVLAFQTETQQSEEVIIEQLVIVPPPPAEPTTAACVPSNSSGIPDGIDNDCDGLIDECSDEVEC